MKLDNKTLFLHYNPGARGDFLAAMLFDSLVDGVAGSVKRPIGKIYKNIHVTDDYSFVENPDNLCIRIGCGLIEDNKWTGQYSSSALQICHNWFTKHALQFSRNPHYMTMEPCEQYYHCVHWYVVDDQAAWQHRDKYAYWLNFKDISNIEVLNNLRIEIIGTPITDSTLTTTKHNISIQQPWQEAENCEMIEQVRQLIDKELESGVFLSHQWDHVSVQDKLATL